MVRYITTPWRDRHELLAVRRQFYPAKDPESSQSQSQSQAQQHTQHHQREQQHQAVARVAMWVQRGGCPHMVESTALLTAAILGDEQDRQEEHPDGQRVNEANAAGEHQPGGNGRRGAVAPSLCSSSSNYASRAAYSAAFSRFVTGLLDGHQSRQHKLSMYAVAKTIGLPATFVELRHQSTHEQLPSLARLRAAAVRALEWVWGYYWAHLGGVGDDGPALTDVERCRHSVLAALARGGGAGGEEGQNQVAELVRYWGQARVVEALQATVDRWHGDDETITSRVVLGALRMAKEALSGQREDLVVDLKRRDLDLARANVVRARQRLEAEEMQAPATPVPHIPASEPNGPDCGWRLCSAEWRPTPIGMV